LADKFLQSTKGKKRNFRSPEPEDVPQDELEEIEKLTSGNFDNKLFNFIQSSDFKGEIAESSVAMILNFLVIAYLITTFQHLGIYSYMYRTESAGDTSVRARQLMFGTTDPTTLDTPAEINEWLYGTFIPQFFSMESYKTTCSMESMRAKPYAFGQLPKIPVFTIRMLGDERTHGCESPYFNFKDEVDVGPFHMNENEKCTSMGRGSDANGDMDFDHGALMFVTAYGMKCPNYPSVPSMISSGCTSENEPLCNASKSFCEGFVWTSRCVNETGNGCALDNLIFENQAVNTAVNKDASYFAAAAYLGKTFPKAFDEYGFRVTGASMFPMEGGPAIVETKDNLPWPDEEQYENNTNVFLYNYTGPFLFTDPSMTCRDNWDTYQTYWIEAVQSVVFATLTQAYSTKTTKGMIITAYYPFKDSTVCEIVAVFSFSDDGSISNEVHMHIKPMTDTIKKGTVDSIMWLALIICLYSWSTYSFVFSHFILFVSTALGFTFAQETKVPTDPNKATRAVGILIAGGWVIGATYWRFHRDVVIDKAGDCYDSGECDSNPVNKLAACGAVVMSYFLGELLIKVFQVYEIRYIYGLPLPLWHIGTFMFDMLVFISACATIFVTTQSSQLVGTYLKRTSQAGGNNIGSPWNAWVEEALYHEVERDKIDGLLVGTLMFFIVIRILKYLSIFPMLGVPVTAIASAGRELVMFMIVLFMFIYAFAMVFMFTFGAQIEEFSGPVSAFQTLFKAVLDGDVDDDVYDDMERMGYQTTHILFGYSVLIIFRMFVAIMFMNMLITIIMEHYGDTKDIPENKFIVNPKEVENYRQYYQSVKSMHDEMFGKLKAQLHILFGGMPKVKLSKRDVKNDPSNVQKMLSSWRVNSSPRPDDQSSCVPQVRFETATEPTEPPKPPTTDVPRVVDADSVEAANKLVSKLSKRLDGQEAQCSEILTNQAAVARQVQELNRIVAELRVHGIRHARKSNKTDHI